MVSISGDVPKSNLGFELLLNYLFFFIWWFKRVHHYWVTHIQICQSIHQKALQELPNVEIWPGRNAVVWVTQNRWVFWLHGETASELVGCCPCCQCFLLWFESFVLLLLLHNLPVLLIFIITCVTITCQYWLFLQVIVTGCGASHSTVPLFESVAATYWQEEIYKRTAVLLVPSIWSEAFEVRFQQQQPSLEV